jgi:hypothetical protein
MTANLNILAWTLRKLQLVNSKQLAFGFNFRVLRLMTSESHFFRMKFEAGTLVLKSVNMTYMKFLF